VPGADTRRIGLPLPLNRDLLVRAVAREEVVCDYADDETMKLLSVSHPFNVASWALFANLSGGPLCSGLTARITSL
jgi:hypothetical protein